MKIDHILYPVDFSEDSLALTSEVEWLAEHYRARVTLMHVFEVPTSWYGAPLLLSSEPFKAFVNAEKERLKCVRLAIPENRVRRIFADGDAAGKVAQWSKDNQVDLIVMGTHGNGGFSRMLLGSVVMKVLHEVACPMWTRSAVIGGGYAQKPSISNIICLVKPSKEAVPLLRFTQELADDFGATVSLVYSVSEEASGPAGYFDSDLHRLLKDAEEKAIRTLQVEAGTNFAIRVTEEPIAEDLAAIGLQQSADLIVTGRGVAQQAFGTWRTQMGDIIRQAPCSVLSYAVGGQALSGPLVRVTQMAGQPV